MKSLENKLMVKNKEKQSATVRFREGDYGFASRGNNT